jgi:hypothetical protein
MEKGLLHPQFMGIGTHHLPTHENGFFLLLDLSKTGQITP